MSISPLYIPLFEIENIILDKDSGLPLSGGIVTFYRDSQRTTPKVVYQITGTSPNYTFTSVGNQLTLGIAGDFVDGNGDPFVPYAYPYDAAGEEDLYYVTVESSGNVAQFVRQAVPYIGDGGVAPEERTNTENELSNPQFVEVSFNGVTVLSVTGANTVTPIAPDWDLITSGTGTVTVERLEPTASAVSTNPPYALRISADAALGASVTLRQRLSNSPSILRGGYVSASLTAAVISGGATALNLVYAPSTGSSTIVIPSTNINTSGSYETIQNNAPIAAQANDPASTGYVDILITIPTSKNIAITSIQVVGTSYSVDIPFDELSAARQKDQLFHYYENATVHQPKTNLLTGWTFALNPWQFTTSASTNVAANQYTADQTIIIQQNFVAAATGNNVAVGRASHTANYAFQITAVTATNKIMMLQYIDPATIRPYWGKKLSVRLKGYLTTTHATSLRFKLRLMYKAGLPNTTSQTVPVGSWTVTDNSIPDVSADGWTYLTSVNDPTYTFGTSSQDFDFDGFVLPASTNANMTLGVALIMMNSMDQTATADVLSIEEISLVNNDFAISASPETWDESFRKCQYYYEKSWPVGVLPTTITDANAKVVKLNSPFLNGVSSIMHFCTFNIDYVQTKRAIPVFGIYSNVSGTLNRISGAILRNASFPAPAAGTNPQDFVYSSNFTTSAYIDRAIISCTDTTTSKMTINAGNSGDNATLTFHYTADSRMGI